MAFVAEREDCDYEGVPVRPQFPAGVAVLVGAAAVLLSMVLTPVIGVVPVIWFCLWRNSKAVCPACGADPFYAPGEPRTLPVGWTSESVALWVLVACCCLVALVSLLVMFLFVGFVLPL